MDTLNGREIANDHDDFEAAGDWGEDAAMDTPPALGSDERRMQVRAYNYWASLLGDRALPSIEDLTPEHLEDFGPHSVLLDFSTGIDNPAIVYLGTALRAECEIEGTIDRINDVPARSLLSRLTDHYLQIIANAAPIGFEAEFINQRGSEILYRGILMPFSSDDETIDFVFGVINWKEMICGDAARSLELEVEQAMHETPPPRVVTPIWADGPIDTIEPLDLAGMEGPRPDAPLSDWLALARDGAEQARTHEGRSHGALYRAIGMAYDFALAAQEAPDDYAALIADAAIKVQARSPMTAIAKLVFGAGYDKTRLTEYAAALDHGWAAGMAQGSFAGYLANYAGGLKALVRDERALRRAEAPPRSDRGAKARASLKVAAAMRDADIVTDADGLAVVVARRGADGTLAIVGSLPQESGLASRVMLAAAR